jgi:hypothetical protein
MPHRAAAVALLAGALLLAAVAWPRASHGQAVSPDTTLEGLVGEKAIVYLRGEFPVAERREIVQLHGTVHAAIPEGVWFKPINRRFKVDKKGDEAKAYTGTVFLPWGSIGYVRLIRNKD